MKDEAPRVGDRVMSNGLKFLNEVDRHGVIAELYEGRISSSGSRERFMAITWDDTGLTERGYIRRFGHIKREPLIVPTVFSDSRDQKNESQ